MTITATVTTTTTTQPTTSTTTTTTHITPTVQTTVGGTAQDTLNDNNEFIDPSSIKLPPDQEMDATSANRTRIYPDDHKGPFLVYIRAYKDQPLRHVHISKHIFGKYDKQQIGKITQMNNHKLRVEFLNAASANNLAETTDPVLAPYRIYIPADDVEVEGIIRLSIEDDERDLLQYGRGVFGHSSVTEVKIIDVHRFERIDRKQTGETSKAPTPIVRVTFPGSLLPLKIALDGLLIPVEPYKRKAMFCENCLRAGHTEKYCVVKPKCAKCGGEHKSNACHLSESLTKCFVCDTNHDPNDRSKCPKVAQANVRQHRKIKQKIAKSYSDAVKASIELSNGYESLYSDTDTDVTVLLAGVQTEGSGPPRPNRKRRRQNPSKQSASTRKETNQSIPSTLRSPAQAGGSVTSPSSAGQSRAQTQPSGSTPGGRGATNNTSSSQFSRSFIHLVRPVVVNFVNHLPISTVWRQLVIKAVNYLFDTILPILSPLITPILMSLLSPSNHGC